MHFKNNNKTRSSSRAACPSILLAEDNPLSREVALRLLETLGCMAEAVADGREAVDRHRARASDLVLMDCDMPVLDGFQATQRIRALDGAARRTPVIALTAGASRDERDRCLSAGMDDFLSKPVRPQDLAAMLARWLPPAYRIGPAAFAGAGGDELDAVQRMFGAGFGELAALYKEGGPPRIAALYRACAAADTAGLAKAAHALAGSSMSIGATGLSALCRRLESDAKAGMPADPGAALAAIEAEYRRVCARLDDMLRPS